MIRRVVLPSSSGHCPLESISYEKFLFNFRKALIGMLHLQLELNMTRLVS